MLTSLSLKRYDWKYQKPVCEAHLALESALQSIMHISNQDKTAELIKRGLSFKQVMEIALQAYASQVCDKDNITWLPALHAKDSKAVPSSYTNSSAHLTAATSPAPRRPRNGNGGGGNRGNNRNKNRNDNRNASNKETSPTSLKK